MQTDFDWTTIQPSKNRTKCFPCQIKEKRIDCRTAKTNTILQQHENVFAKQFLYFLKSFQTFYYVIICSGYKCDFFYKALSI